MDMRIIFIAILLLGIASALFGKNPFEVPEGQPKDPLARNIQKSIEEQNNPAIFGLDPNNQGPKQLQVIRPNQPYQPGTPINPSVTPIAPQLQPPTQPQQQPTAPENNTPSPFKNLPVGGQPSSSLIPDKIPEGYVPPPAYAPKMALATGGSIEFAGTRIFGKTSDGRVYAVPDGVYTVASGVDIVVRDGHKYLPND